MKLAKNYEPNQYEPDIYDIWEQSKAFTPEKGSHKDSFTIVMPPPNANANLHIGMGLTVAIQDAITRHQRLKGKNALYLPGSDHAGFETQSVYEKQLAKEGKSRFDFSREELYARIWDFVDDNRGVFEKQVRQMGASCDWSRYTFTLDQKIIDQAYKTFKKMWDEGLIYRSERLVNFCTYHGTGFADIEVEHKETKGKIWSIRYPLTDGSGEIVVATTRPETMLGDTAVAVHPKDTRYKDMVGKTVKLPLTKREIPIIADEYVEKDFGTGAVKITPAHDFNDYEVGKRHDLPMIQVIGHDGKINHNAPDNYRNLDVKNAREKVINDLESEGFLVEVKEHINSVGHCYKCGTVIEPMFKEQWFVDMQPLAKEAIKALKAKKITFYPDTKRTQLIAYLENLRDWNISRQIAWGVPIPAFVNIDDSEDWIFCEEIEKEQIEKNGKTYRRDPDVFDTWFTSSSWPYATMSADDQKQFYPNSLMETGGEILQPWVSRMIMLGLYVKGEIPFKEVYIHGYVMAEDGSKMSKSIGNVIDPLPVIEKYGSDALRMGLISGRSAGVNRGFDSRRVEEARNFCNKIWNISRFIEDKLDQKPLKTFAPKPETEADHWILHKLADATTAIDEYMENYRLSEAYDSLYHFVWDDFADWYIEASKTAPNASILAHTLSCVLKIAHPFAPFLTETIWQTMHPDKDSLLIKQSWPKNHDYSKGKAKDFEKVQKIVSELRHIKTTLHIKKGGLYYNHAPFVSAQSELIKSLVNLENVGQVKDGRGLSLISVEEKCWLDVDLDSVERFNKELEGQITDIEKQVGLLESRLANANYVAKAPKELVDESKQKLADLNNDKEVISKQIEHYKAGK